MRSDHGDLKKRKGKGKAGKDDEKDGRGLLFRLLVAGKLSPAADLLRVDGGFRSLEESRRTRFPSR